MMNDQLPIGGSGSGTLVLGDITIVQNHNFGAPQPMQMMQQQMMIQQMQNQQMQTRLMLGMAAMVAKTAETMKLAGSSQANPTLIGESEVLNEKPAFKLAAPEKVKIDTIVAEDVEYSVVENDPVDVFLKNKPNTVVNDAVRINQTTMLKFFQNGQLMDDVEFNKIQIIDELTNAFALFVRTSKDPTSWRDVFRESYIKQTKSAIKTYNAIQMLKNNAVFYVFIYDNADIRPNVICITKSNSDNINTMSSAREAVDNAGVQFRSFTVIEEPVVLNDLVENPFNKDFSAKRCDCIFSSGYYLV